MQRHMLLASAIALALILSTVTHSRGREKINMHMQKPSPLPPRHSVHAEVRGGFSDPPASPDR
eukprot:5786986-Pyramimonas_sp.AAC.1